MKQIEKDIEKTKWELLNTAQGILKFPNPINKCHRISTGSVKVVKGKDGSVGYRGVVTCKSAWACPICSPRLAKKKAEAIAMMDSRLMYKRVMVTYTVQHSIKDRLDDLIDILYNSLRRARQGRKHAEFKEIALGYVRSTEITYGKNGWHAHIHEMIYLRPDKTIDDVMSTVVKHYKEGVAMNGRLVNQHTVDVKKWDGDSGYVTKGTEIDEVVGWLNKSGQNSLNIFGILRVAEDSDRHKDLYRHYYYSTKGRKMTMVSRSLMDEYKYCESEIEKEMENWEEAEVVKIIPADAWKNICNAGVRYQLLLTISDELELKKA